MMMLGSHVTEITEMNGNITFKLAQDGTIKLSSHV